MYSANRGESLNAIHPKNPTIAKPTTSAACRAVFPRCWRSTAGGAQVVHSRSTSRHMKGAHHPYRQRGAVFIMLESLVNNPLECRRSSHFLYTAISRKAPLKRLSSSSRVGTSPSRSTRFLRNAKAVARHAGLLESSAIATCI